MPQKEIRRLRAQIKEIVDLKQYRKWARSHPNFMTPYILRLANVGAFVIELSEGTDFHRKLIYGVTTLKLSGSTFDNMQQIDGLNKMFYSREEANQWIQDKAVPFAIMCSLILNGSPCLGWACGIESDKCNGNNFCCLIFKNYLKAQLGITWSA